MQLPPTRGTLSNSNMNPPIAALELLSNQSKCLVTSRDMRSVFLSSQTLRLMLVVSGVTCEEAMHLCGSVRRQISS